MAMSGFMPFETALRISNDPRKGMILREMKKDRQKKAMEEAATMVNIQTVQQIAAEMGLGPEAATELATKLQKARYAEMNQQEQQQQRAASAFGAIESVAQEDTRMESLTQT
jgi:protein-disulfide isomerase-like protein with CxxC motif